MANIRAMAVFQGHSALPEDRYVNTWHFQSVGTFENSILDAVGTMETFYGNTVGQTHPIGAWLSPTLNRPWEIRAYDLDDPPPRVPSLFPQVLPSAASTSGLPEEVAAVLSIHGAPPVTARRRGRIYIGPLAQGGIVSADVDTYSALHPQLITDLRTAAGLALSSSLANFAGWAIRSSVPAPNFVPVTGGWVDNAIDIQRRRGADATVRETWVAAPI